jgi:hypothetical protein
MNLHLSQVLVDVDSRDREYNELAPVLDTAKKRKKDSPSPIALEPCVGNKAAVLSLLVRMPTGKFPRTTVQRSHAGCDNPTKGVVNSAARLRRGVEV